MIPTESTCCESRSRTCSISTPSSAIEAFSRNVACSVGALYAGAVSIPSRYWAAYLVIISNKSDRGFARNSNAWLASCNCLMSSTNIEFPLVCCTAWISSRAISTPIAHVAGFRFTEHYTVKLVSGHLPKGRFRGWVLPKGLGWAIELRLRGEYSVLVPAQQPARGSVPGVCYKSDCHTI